MEEKKTGFAPDKRSENDNRKVQPNASANKLTPTTPQRESWRKRWNAVQFSKTAIVWACLAMIVGTMIVGFTWGGWVTDGTSQKTATTMANTAVVQRLSAICIAQFQMDPAKAQKLTELKAASSYQRGTYVKDQGWSMMPGEEESDTKVATECGKQLALIE